MGMSIEASFVGTPDFSSFGHTTMLQRKYRGGTTAQKPRCAARTTGPSGGGWVGNLSHQSEQTKVMVDRSLGWITTGEPPYMSSRRKRKRKRQLAEATVQTPKTRGGWGHGAPTTLTDLVCLRRAIREGWPVSADIRQAILDELCDDMLPSIDGDSGSGSVRRLLSCVRSVIEMGSVNQAVEHAAGAARKAHTAPTCAIETSSDQLAVDATGAHARPWAD
jgi:hypothetical protein